MLSEEIRKYRKQAGLSQEELADRLEVSRQAVSKWEMGQSAPDPERIVRMSELYGIGRGLLGLKRRILLGMYATMEDARKELAAIAEQSGERASYQLRYACKMDGVRIAE